MFQEAAKHPAYFSDGCRAESQFPHVAGPEAVHIQISGTTFTALTRKRELHAGSSSANPLEHIPARQMSAGPPHLNQSTLSERD